MTGMYLIFINNFRCIYKPYIHLKLSKTDFVKIDLIKSCFIKENATVP